MELLTPTHPPHHDTPRETPSGFSPPASVMPDEIVEEIGCVRAEICVAVGKKVDKAVSLLHWSFRRFGCSDICILHVHKPSPVIPTLLGKLPASQANPKVVSAYRWEEKAQMKTLLEKYLIVCRRSKVKASIITIEADQVQKGIVELTSKHSVRKLVMGGAPENCMRMKKISNKVTYASKNAPPFCEIWFVNKGKHCWTREASSDLISLAPFSQEETPSTMISRSKSLPHRSSHSSSHIEGFLFRCTTSAGCIDDTSCTQNEANLPISRAFSSSSCRYLTRQYQSSLSNTNSECASDERITSESDSKVFKGSLCNQLGEAITEAETYTELLKCHKVEVEAFEAMEKIRHLESTHAHEVKLRREAEEALRTTLHEQEKLEEEKDEMTRELQKTMRSIALLDSHVQEAGRRCDGAAGELMLIQASIATLRQEKQKIRCQKMEAVRWLERWRSCGRTGPANCYETIGPVEDLRPLPEFSLADLQSATCNFSESFKIGKRGFGCVYKGEMLGRTVTIKKLYPLYIQGLSEFQKEVQVLSKLQHPHLVNLLGVCPEAWSIVYEYMPNGCLHECLFGKTNVSPLPWKTRAQIIAEISSALCFLHCSKPEKIVHGDLKPENILLDSELSCKICDFGISRLVNEDTLHCPSFRRTTERRGAFPYADPEFHRIGFITPKSDIYSFGLIILQLLTGKPPMGLVGEVRKAVSCSRLAAVLDTSAGEWPMFVAQRLANLGLQCCETYGRDRPDLRPSLVRELQHLHLEERTVPSFFLCPILQEIMHDPLVAADGFTYEGEAIRRWIENGAETSPMTNLTLSHLGLTPNHALRIAIQDWLCTS